MTAHEIATPALANGEVSEVSRVQASNDAGFSDTPAENHEVSGVSSLIPALEDRPCYRVLDDHVKDASGKTTHRAGVWYFGSKDGKGDNPPILTERWICSPLHL